MEVCLNDGAVGVFSADELDQCHSDRYEDCDRDEEGQNARHDSEAANACFQGLVDFSDFR